MSSTKSSKHLDELDVLDAERIIFVARFRVRLLKEAFALLPKAVQQAELGKPALLRLVSRIATQRTLRDRGPAKP